MARMRELPVGQVSAPAQRGGRGGGIVPAPNMGYEFPSRRLAQVGLIARAEAFATLETFDGL
jgi:hypothetical protein